MKHENNGHCGKCLEIFARYPGFHYGLKAWFMKLQTGNPDAHVSCAGRGSVEQEECFHRGASKAHWGQSAHNHNAAIDIFRLGPKGAEWPLGWFKLVVGPAVFAHNSSTNSQFKITWYGAPGSTFYELPHCEVAGWKMANYSLVEPA